MIKRNSWEICKNCDHPLYWFGDHYEHCLPIMCSIECFAKKGTLTSCSEEDPDYCGCKKPEVLEDSKKAKKRLLQYSLAKGYEIC